jgi:hypothetical protein
MSHPCLGVSQHIQHEILDMQRETEQGQQIGLSHTFTHKGLVGQYQGGTSPETIDDPCSVCLGQPWICCYDRHVDFWKVDDNEQCQGLEWVPAP